MNSQKVIIHELIDLFSVFRVLPPEEKNKQLELIKTTLLDYPNKLDAPMSNYHISMAKNNLKNGLFNAFNSSLESALSFID